MRICIKKTTWSVPPELVKTEKQKKKLLQMFSAQVVERRVPEDKIPKPTALPSVRIHTCAPDPEKGSNCGESEALIQIKESTKIKKQSATPAVKIHTRVPNPEKLGHYSETLTHIKVSAAAHKPRNGDYVFPLATEANKVKLIDVGIMPQVMHSKAYEAVAEHLRSKISLLTPVAKKVKQTPTPKKKRQGRPPVKRAKIELKTEKPVLAESEQIASFKILPATTPCSIRLTRIKIPVVIKTDSPVVEPAPAATPSETDQPESPVQLQEQELIKD